MAGFSFEEIGEDPETGEQAPAEDSQEERDLEARAAQVVDSLDENQESRVDDALQDVDLRLEIADFYRTILRHEFFEVDREAAKRVHHEIRAFVRERLETLLGIRAPKPVVAPPPVVEVRNPFSDEETAALRLMASKVLSKPGLVASAPAPVVKKMSLPPKPQVKKIPVPPVPPATKPQAGPANKPQKPGPKPKKKVAPTASNTQTFVSHEGEEVTLVEGQEVEENGRKFLVVRNGKGTLYRKDITGQVVNPNRIPPMSPEQLEVHSRMAAEQQIERLDGITGAAVIASLK